MFDTVNTNEIFSYVEQSLDEENFFNYMIKLKTAKVSFVGHEVFVQVEGVDHNKFVKTLDLVVKTVGLRNREDTQRIREAFRREIFYYNNIFPLVENLLSEHKKMQIDCLPTCYHTIATHELEVLLFNDLQKLGYLAHERKVPMNLAHMKMIFYSYAKLHSVFFALRKQKPEFRRVMSNHQALKGRLFRRQKVSDMLKKGITTTCKILAEADAIELREKFVSVTQKGYNGIIEDVLAEVPKEWVLTHGDSWNDNFVFKYKDGDNDEPTQMIIQNWQYSTPHSPVLDLSLALYCFSSKKELSHFRELLDFYYEWLTFFTRSFDCDVYTEFPFSTLVEHWKKYSVYALVMAAAALSVVYDEDTSNNEGDGKECCGEDTKLNSKWRDLGDERMLAIVEHYCDFVYSTNTKWWR